MSDPLAFFTSEQDEPDKLESDNTIIVEQPSPEQLPIVKTYSEPTTFSAGLCGKATSKRGRGAPRKDETTNISIRFNKEKYAVIRQNYPKKQLAKALQNAVNGLYVGLQGKGQPTP